MNTFISYPYKRRKYINELFETTRGTTTTNEDGITSYA